MTQHSLSGSLYNNNAVSLGFFDDIIIPHQNLQHPKRLYPLTVHKTGILMSLNIISALYNICLIVPCFGSNFEGGWIYTYTPPDIEFPSLRFKCSYTVMY